MAKEDKTPEWGLDLKEQIEVLAQATAKGFDLVHGKIDTLEKDVNSRFDVVDQKLERIERRLDEHGETLISLDTRVGRLEKSAEPVA